MPLPPPSLNTQLLVFNHEDGKEPEVQTKIIKMFRARFGGKLTVSQRLIEGTGTGLLYLGKSDSSNPSPEMVTSISDPKAWSVESEIILNNDLILYPLLVISTEFTDTNAAKVEVAISLSWSPSGGR